MNSRYLALLLLIPLWLVVVGFWGWTTSRRSESHPSAANALYADACVRALRGEGDEAILSLREAVRRGYANRKHMSQDEDLASLRDREDFRHLLSEISGEGPLASSAHKNS